MVNYSDVRIDNVLGFIQMQKRHSKKWSEIINERNELHIELNKKYGFSDSDGYISSAIYPCPDKYKPEYPSAFLSIQNKYEKILENTRIQHDKEKESVDLTIWEYLLIDNSGRNIAEEAFIDALEKRIHTFDLIELQASIVYKSYFSNISVKEIPRKIYLIKQSFNYSVERCHKHFKLSKLNLKAYSAIHSFKSIYMKEIKKLKENHDLKS